MEVIKSGLRTMDDWSTIEFGLDGSGELDRFCDCTCPAPKPPDA
jgi:hypothetical protein